MLSRSTLSAQKSEVRMFCPECKAEYRPGFTQCNDCNVALVEHLDPAPDREEHEDDAPRVVFTASDLVEADVVKSLLEASGIEVYMPDESQILPVGNIELAVPETQEASALEILTDYRANTEPPTNANAAA